MSVNVKYVFHLKSGKTFECIEKLTPAELLKAIDIIKTSMREGVDGMILFEDCCVRLSDCAVVEWEVLDEEQSAD